ncbi:MAG: type II secretion system F family protein, partial [Chloroflexota bacterium]
MFVRYVAYNWLGRRLEGILEAQSEDAARETLERDQLIPYRLRAVVRRRSLVQLAPALFRPGDQPLIDFTRELDSLLRAGLPLRQALTSLREETRSLGFREALRQVIQTIEGGGAFSEACSQQPSVFPGFYARLLHVAEATGAIGTVLQRVAETLEKRKAVKDRVRAALVYPAISMGVAVIATFVLMTYSLPALVRM